MAEICRYWSSRPQAWGPGALVKRLTSLSAPGLASDQAWPPPSPKEKHEATLRQHQADERQSRKDAECSDQRRSREQQLELQFGEQVDRLPVETLIKLLDAGGNRFAIGELRRSYKDDPDGRRRPDIRNELLKSFAAKAASN